MTAILAFLTSKAGRAIAAALLTLTVLGALTGLAYRGGSRAATTRAELVAAKLELANTAAITAARADTDRVTREAATKLTAALTAQGKLHDQIARDLRTSLDASTLRTALLTRDIRGLLDSAATGIPGPAAGHAAGTGDAVGAAEDPDPASCADAIESAAGNYAIARRNAARLDALQGWYLGVQKAYGESDPHPYR